MRVLEDDFLEDDFFDGDPQSMLYGYFFWNSAEIYLNSMKIFISSELSGEEFVARILLQLYYSMDQCHSLQEDFKKQLILKLDPEFSRFSTILYNLSSVATSYDEGNLMEDQLRQIITDDIFPKFEEYFNDKI